MLSNLSIPSLLSAWAGLGKSFSILPAWLKLSSLMIGSSMIGISLFAWLDGEQVTANRARFDAMDGSEKNELIRKWNRFQALPESKQQQFRDFQKQLKAEPDAERLQAVLNGYSNWLLTVRPAQRIAFKEGDLESRMAAVKDERIQQYLRTIGTDEETRLLMDDARTLLAWTKSLGPRGFRPDPSDFDQLQLALSRKPRELMAALAAGTVGPQDEDAENRGDLRGQLVFNWLREIRAPAPNDRQLKEIYESLDDEQKQELLKLFEENDSPNVIRARLTQFYRQSLGLEDFWGRGSRSRRGDGRDSPNRQP